MMKITEYIRENITYLDGSTGTLLQSHGLPVGVLPETWNREMPEVLVSIHKAYFDAGSNIVATNTFGANSLKYTDEELEKIISSAIANVKIAKDTSCGSQPKWIALDVGPLGKMLRPYGDLDFEDAVAIFAKTIKLGVKYGADLIYIETMNDSYETKAALLAAKENSTLPVFVSLAFDESGKLMTGANPHSMIAMLEGMGADAIGANCSLGPCALRPVMEEFLKYSSLPIILKPNAGLPHAESGIAKYDVGREEFAREVAELTERGVRLIGGCCGTTPEYISALVLATKDINPKPTQDKGITVASSYTHTVTFGYTPVIIGERINPTGKPRLKEALKCEDFDYILKEGIAEDEAGAHILDVNVGLPGIDEVKTLTRAISSLQSVVNLPLQIDTADVAAMEAALRIYNGKAVINSVSGKEESMNVIFPLAKKYGGVIIALTLDERGIPSSAEERILIAKKILSRAEDFGIQKKDIIFDPLAMAVSTDKYAARETLRAVKMLKGELGVNTSLGISNVSFGLPRRDIINSQFFALALENGLSAGIINPLSTSMMGTYYAYRALMGMDENFADYIAYAETLPTPGETTSKPANSAKEEYSSSLERAIVKGLSGEAAELTEKMLSELSPMDIINSHIVPALNIVGVGFENKTVYLPALLMSAESAKAAFEVIKVKMGTSGENTKMTRTVIATVKGDIHDIGKNIVKSLLENYGFSVIDLGRDVSPEVIVDKVAEVSADVLGLSALMTTTLPYMKETIELLRARKIPCRVVVGGAVLTEEYAYQIGADRYAKDAMATVRYLEEIEEKMKQI